MLLVTIDNVLSNNEFIENIISLNLNNEITSHICFSKLKFLALFSRKFKRDLKL